MGIGHRPTLDFNGSVIAHSSGLRMISCQCVHIFFYPLTLYIFPHGRVKAIMNDMVFAMHVMP